MRWTSLDSILGRIYDPLSLNKYAYVRNDPVNLIDPDGRLLSKYPDSAWWPYDRYESPEHRSVVPPETPSGSSWIDQIEKIVQRDSTDLRNVTRLFLQGSPGCRKYFSDAGMIEKINSSIAHARFCNASDVLVGQLPVSWFGFSSTTTLSAYYAAINPAAAAVLNGTTPGTISNNVIIGDRWIGLGDVDKIAILFHEILHITYQKNDKELLSALGIGAAPPSYILPASSYIRAWLEQGCPTESSK